VVALAILAFALGGAWRGAVAQALSMAGVVAGLWSAGWIAQWVGLHWQGARPAVVFWLLKWIVAALGGLAVASLLQWWGDSLREAVQAGPLGWLDRAGGLVAGAAYGLLVATFALLMGLLAAWPRELADAAAGARVSAPLMRAGLVACETAGGLLPGRGWLESKFRTALERTRSRSARS